ncbi:MAG: ABC transporter substrate-binding protein [Anaerolineae bacterium]|nr:ABC transporter substrate-binding protein [Anaerolineae bacterium]MDW8101929.1 ABC transporter substrate-binding protein [Anaerolineae bacterium]
MSKAKFFAALIVLIIVAAILSNCAPREPQVYKIGIFSPTTGPAAADGTSALNAARLAVKFINEAGGVRGKKLELIHYDDAAKPDQAVSVVRKLIEQDKVIAIISGSYSGATRAAASVCQEAGVVMLSAYAVHPDITRTGDKIFRVGVLGTVEGRVGGALVVEKLGAKRIAILTLDNDFGRSITEGFKSYLQGKDVQIVFEEKYPLGETEFKAILQRVKDANPDVLFASAYYSEAAHLVRQAKEIGLKAQIVGQEGYDSPKFLELAGEAAEGVIIITDLNRDDPREIVQKFLKEYQKEYGIPADMVGASAFDAVQILAWAIEKGGPTTEGIVKALKELKNFDKAVTGPILYYTPGREAVRPIGVQIVKGGAFRYFAHFDDPALITPPQ